MKHPFFFQLSVLLLAASHSLVEAAASQDSVLWQLARFEISNPLNVARDDLLCVPEKQLPFSFSEQSAITVQVNGHSVESQVMPCFYDNNQLGLAVNTPMSARQTLPMTVYWSTTAQLEIAKNQLTKAELQVRVGGKFKGGKLIDGTYLPVSEYVLPKQHEVGNKLFKYEGLGWESEKIAFRYYFDHRGAIDIFAKQQNGLVLAEVGIDGDDYHVLDDWGMDVLKVGPSLGLGGLGVIVREQLVGLNDFSDLNAKIKNSELVSSIQLSYKNWSTGAQVIDLSFNAQIAANSMLTKVTATPSKAIEHLTTGIVKHGVETIKHQGDKASWSYLATWGEQGLTDDTLGMAIIFKSADLSSLKDDEYNELVVFNQTNKPQHYLFTANWGRSPSGAKSKKDFIHFLDKELAKLNQPIVLKQQ